TRPKTGSPGSSGPASWPCCSWRHWGQGFGSSNPVLCDPPGFPFHSSPGRTEAMKVLRSELAVSAGELNARAQTLLPRRLRKPLTTVVRRVAWIHQWLVPQPFQPATRSAFDYRVTIALGLIGALIAAAGNTAFDPRVNDYWNIYFHADPNRILNDI